MRQEVFIIQFTEGELAELLHIISCQANGSEFYPDYWQRLAGEIQTQVNTQLQNKFFQCALCLEKAKAVRQL